MADEISPEELARLMMLGDMSEANRISDAVPRRAENGNVARAGLLAMGTPGSMDMTEIGKAGDEIKNNAHLFMETKPVRIAKAISRFATGETPYAGPGLRREDYTDDPEAKQPIEPMINDAANVADFMSMGSLPSVALRGAQRHALGIGVPPKPSLEQRIESAFHDVAGRPAMDAVRLHDLRARLSDVPRAELDAALLGMKKSGRANLMNLDNPRDIAKVGDSALRSGNNAYHVLWLEP